MASLLAGSTSSAGIGMDEMLSSSTNRKDVRAEGAPDGGTEAARRHPPDCAEALHVRSLESSGDARAIALFPYAAAWGKRVGELGARQGSRRRQARY